MNTIPGMPQGGWQAAADGSLLKTGDGRVLMVSANHTATATLALNDSTDGSGADFMTLQVPANKTLVANFTRIGGVPFATGCYVAFTYAELMANIGFETAGGGGADVFGTWAETAGDGAIADEGTIVHGGSHAAKLTSGTTSNTKLAQTVTVVASETYRFTFWTRGDGTNAGRYLIYDVSNAANIVATTSTSVPGTTYTKVTVAFSTPVGCTSVRLDLMCPGVDTGIAYFDDASLVAVAGVQILID